MEWYIGRYARNIESGWLGQVVAVERFDGQDLLKMQGVNELCQMVAGGSAADWLDSDDTQWHDANDLRFIPL